MSLQDLGPSIGNPSSRTVEARKLEDDCPATPKPTKKVRCTYNAQEGDI